MSIKDIAKKISSARAAGGGNYLKDGRGRLIIKALKHEDLFEGETFIAEMIVESSESFPDAVDLNGKPVVANAPGSIVSFVQQYKKHPLTAFSNVKAFLLTLTGENEAEVTEEEFEEYYTNAVGKDQPLAGAVIDYSTYRKTTKDGKTVLTLPKWSHVPQTAEAMAERRERLFGMLPERATQPTAAA